MIFKKFFNVEDGEEPAGGGEATAEAAQPDILELFAKHGRIVNDGEPAPEYKSAETTDGGKAESSDVASDKLDEPPATKEEALDVPPPPAPEQTVDWKELVRQKGKEAPKEVLLELGLEEPLLNLIEHYRNGGDVKEYLAELSTDYASMSAEEVMKHQLRNEYPNATERQLDILYKKEVVEKYQIGEDYDEEQQEEGRLLLDLHAQKFRNQLIERQKQRLIPAAPPPAQVQQHQEDEAAVQVKTQLDKNLKSIQDSDFYKRATLAGKIAIGEGDEAYNIPVKTDELIGILYDPEQFVQTLFKVEQGKDGIMLSSDPEHQLLVAAVSKYGKQLFVDLANHYKGIGAAKAIKPIENPSTPSGQTGAINTDGNLSAAGLLAKYGKLS